MPAHASLPAHRREKRGVLQLAAEIPAVHRVAEDGFQQRLQIAERERVRKDGEDERRRDGALAQGNQRRLEKRGMVERERRKLPHVGPAEVRLLARRIAEQRGVEHADHMATRVTPGVSVGDHLLQGRVLLDAEESLTLAQAPSLLNAGLEVLNFSILAIKPVPETSKALEAEARERLLREADDALYSRRNNAVEQQNMADAVTHLLLGQKAPEVPRMRFGWDDSRLAFVVREPFRSKWSGVSLGAGLMAPGHSLEIESHMPGAGVVFSDGVETDAVDFNAGAVVDIHASKRQTILVAAVPEGARARAARPAWMPQPSLLDAPSRR